MAVQTLTPGRRWRAPLSGLPLHWRLFWAVGLPVLVVLCAAVLALVQLNRAQATMATLVADRLVPMAQLKTVSDAFAVDVVDLTHKSRDGGVSPGLARMQVNDAIRRADRAWTDYLATKMTPEEQRLINWVEPHRQRARELSKDLMQRLASFNEADMRRFAATDLYPVIDPLSHALLPLLDLQQAEAARLVSEQDQQLGWVATLVGCALLLTTVGAMAIAAWLANSTLRSVNQLTLTAQALAKGQTAQHSEAPHFAADAGGVGALLAAMDGIRQQLAFTNQGMAHLLKVAPLPVLTLERADNLLASLVRDCNPAFEQVFGFTRGQLTGQALSALSLWVDPAQLPLSSLGDEINTSTLWHHSLAVRNAAGGHLMVQVTLMRGPREPSGGQALWLSFEEQRPSAQERG
jgi:PAS domain-containing protein